MKEENLYKEIRYGFIIIIIILTPLDIASNFNYELLEAGSLFLMLGEILGQLINFIINYANYYEFEFILKITNFIWFKLFMLYCKY